MIFVTVVTHEQQFNRLIKTIDELKINNIIKEDVIIQTGFSTYEPKACKWKKLYPYKQMLKYVEDARIVITHGGPSSFIMPLQVGKIPIVVPRKKEYDEHVNNHQVLFCREVEKKQKNILVVEEINDLQKIIGKYDEIVSEMTNSVESNNGSFCREFEKIVRKLLDE